MIVINYKQKSKELSLLNGITEDTPKRKWENITMWRSTEIYVFRSTELELYFPVEQTILIHELDK